MAGGKVVVAVMLGVVAEREGGYSWMYLGLGLSRRRVIMTLKLCFDLKALARKWAKEKPIRSPLSSKATSVQSPLRI